MTARTATNALTTACYGIAGGLTHWTLADCLGRAETLGWIALAACVTMIVQLATKAIWADCQARLWRKRNPLPTTPDIPMPRQSRPRYESNHPRD